MAINTKPDEGVEVLDPLTSRLSALGSILVCLAGATLMLILSLTSKLAAGSGAYVVGWVFLLAFVIGASVQLIRGQVWAQRFLLVFWMVASLVSLLLVLTHVLGGSDGKGGLPAWWPAELGAWTVVLPALLLSVGVVVLLSLTSPANTRLRYGTYSCVSGGIVVALVIVVNLIAQSDPIHIDFESLGSYGVSQRTRTVLSSVKEPITATVVYTSTDEKRLGKDYVGRVLDQLEEMKLRLRQVRKDAALEIVNITNDTDKARFLARIREKIASQAGGHVKLVRSVEEKANQLAQSLQEELKTWESLPEESYLRLWQPAPRVEDILTDLAQQVVEIRNKVQRETQGTALTDYAALVNEVKSVLEETQKPLEKIAALYESLGKIPAEVAKNKAGAMDAVTKAAAAVKAMAAALGDQEVPPAQAAQTLKSFAQAAQAASDQLINAAEALVNVGGKDNAKYVRLSRVWIYERVELSMLLQAMGGSAGELAEEAATYQAKTTPQAMVEFIQARRPYAKSMTSALEGVVKAVSSAVDLLGRKDASSDAMLKRAEGGKLFDRIVTPLKGILDEIAKLPELKEDTFVRDLAQENIVVVEVGDKAKVVSFDEMYPVRGRMNMMGPQEPEKRSFNGDSAVSSKILAMTRKPFATVLMTFLAQDPMMARQMRMPGGITPGDLTLLRRKLEDANFHVADWDLAQEKPTPVWVCGACGHEDSKSPVDPRKCEKCGAEGRFEKRPQVMLVLPPAPPMPPMGMGAPPMPGFGPQQVEKIRQAVDSGTPGVIMAHWMPPMGMMGAAMPFPLNDYLRTDWGIEVQGEFRLISGVPDEKEPNKYRIDLVGLGYLPISSYTDHPIGQPLQAQSNAWVDVCPLVKVAAREGVEVQNVLDLPGNRSNVWAVRNVRGLYNKVLTGTAELIAPEDQDLRTPLTVAVAATRDAAVTKDDGATQPATMPAVKPARVVVLGMGRSFLDEYLENPSLQVGSKGEYIRGEPPAGNVDLIINSAYWLSGNKEYIAAGPVQVKPVNVPETTWKWLYALCVIGLPLLVVAAGAMVMFTRRA